MKIVVKLGEPLWREIGEKQVTLDLQLDATIEDLISELADQYPALQEFLDQAEIPPTVFLADELVNCETKLKERDSPTLIWAVSGGWVW